MTYLLQPPLAMHYVFNQNYNKIGKVVGYCQPKFLQLIARTVWYKG